MQERIAVNALSALIELGFVPVAYWKVQDDHLTLEIDKAAGGEAEALLHVPNALYAFSVREEVLYIGKTTRSVRQRFQTLRRPGRTQRTNIRNHRLIREAIAEGKEIRVSIFAPISALSYGGFEINLAAGLEDALIRDIDPAWNGSPTTGRAITETARQEQESDAEADQPEVPEPGAPAESPVFQIVLGETYYTQGTVNPGVEASRHLGEDGALLRVRFDDGYPDVLTRINRTANRSGGVRFVGGTRALARWFQTHFEQGARATARICGPHEVLFLSKPDTP